METILTEINENLKTIITLLKQTDSEKNEKKQKKTTEKKEKKTKKSTTKTKAKTKTEIKMKSKKKTYLTKYTNGILLHGNTFDYRSFIKSIGGFWNNVYKGWIVSESYFEDIAKEITELSYDNKTLDKNLIDQNGNPYTLYAKKKTNTTKSTEDDDFLLDSDSD